MGTPIPMDRILNGLFSLPTGTMKWIIATMLALMPFLTHAGEWIADAKSNCQVWNLFPSPGESISWTGACANGKATGKGTLQWYLNGTPKDRYEGEYRDGYRHGVGTQFYADGTSYEGEWRNGQMNGNGTRIYPSGDRYEGEWSDGQRQGRGTYVWASGSRYEGEYKNNEQRGFGVLRIVRNEKVLPAWEKSGKGKWVGDKYVQQGMWEGDNKLTQECPSKIACGQQAAGGSPVGSPLTVAAKYGAESCSIVIPAVALSDGPVNSEKIMKGILSSTWGKDTSGDKPYCENGLAQGLGQLAVVLKGEYWKFHGNVINGRYQGKVDFTILKDTSSVVGRGVSKWVIDDKGYSEADYFAALNSRNSVPGTSETSKIDQKELAKKIKACNTVGSVDCVKSTLMNLAVVPCKAPVEERYSVYRGACGVNGTPSGWGIATTSNAKSGDFVLGEFSNGELDGFGAVRRTSCSNLDCFAGRYVTEDNFGWFQGGTKQLDCTSTSKPVCVEQDKKNRQEQQRLAEQRRLAEQQQQQANRQTSSPSSGGDVKYVQIRAECITGSICPMSNLSINGSGNYSPGFKGSSFGAIHPNGSNPLAGSYSFSVLQDKRICSGSFHLSGTKGNVTLNLYPECRVAGVDEF
jgi:hypothetical protein